MNTLKSTAKNSRKKAQETQKTNWFFYLLFLCFLCLFAANTFAYSGGDGTSNNPYQIADVNDLLQLANETSDPYKDPYRSFILTADINLAGQVFSNAVIGGYNIQGVEYPFRGDFDGAGHKITNLIINAPSQYHIDLGLFGGVGCDARRSKIKNLGLENVSITNSSDYSESVGGLAGSNYQGIISNCYSVGISIYVGDNPRSIGGLVGGSSYGTISNCYSKGIIITGSMNGYPLKAGSIGGLAGGNSGEISNSYSTCDVNGGDSLDGVGGLVGSNGDEYGAGLIENCYSTGTVRVDNGVDIGGLVGDNFAYINNCFSTSNVIGGGSSSYVGGLVGGHGWNYINNCYATGDVNGGDGSYRLGGLVGGVGGYTNFINNCYSTGHVSSGGSVSIGGLVGALDYGTINSSYFLDVSGPNNGLGTPLTDSQMKKQASFAGWDFVGETANGTDDIWRMCVDDVNYPLLWWQFNEADFTCPDGVDFADFAKLAEWWENDDCADNNNCDNTDIDLSGTVDIYDLKLFCGNWLE